MEVNLGQYEKIQRYLDEEMSPKEKAEFESELQLDAVLKEYCSFEIALRDNLEEEQLGENLIRAISGEVGSVEADDPLRNTIAQTGTDWVAARDTRDELAVKKIVPFGAWLSFAAAACILTVVLSIVWWSPARPPSPASSPSPAVAVIPPAETGHHQPDLTALYQASFEKDKPPARPPQLLAEALTNYGHGRYEDLQKIELSTLPRVRSGGLEDVNNYRNTQEIGHYYKGLSFMETNNAAAARVNLQWVTDSARNRLLAGKAQWYLSLLALKEHDLPRTVTLLQILSHNTDADPYDTKAGDLLKKLTAVR